MTKGKKVFDKKSSLHFKLVQKSVKDKSGSGVDYEPLNEVAYDNIDIIRGEREEDADFLPCQDLENVEENSDMAKIVDEKAEDHGIYLDSSKYDYMRHLKKMGQVPGAVFIPSTTVSATSTKDYENLSSQETADEDVAEVLEALDDEAFVDENFLDDFVVSMNRDDTAVLCPVVDTHNQQNYDYDDGDDCGSIDSFQAAPSIAPSMAFTSIDSKFDAILNEYDQDNDNLSEISLSGDDEDGESEDSNENIQAEMLKEALDDFIKTERDFLKPSAEVLRSKNHSFLDEVRSEMGGLTERILDLELSDDIPEDSSLFPLPKEKERWDCQSILSTRTNTDNLPKVISERTRPNNYESTNSHKSTSFIPHFYKNDEGKDNDCTDSSSIDENDKPKLANKGEARNKAETAEEKRFRKANVKAERREARSLKKERKVHFNLL